MRQLFLTLAVLFSLNPLLCPAGKGGRDGQADEGKKVYCCAYDGFVVIRNVASYVGDKVGQFRNGPEGAVLLEDHGAWVKVDVAGTIGYVPAKYVQDTPTVAYTGDVTVNWIEGIWGAEGGYVLMIYNNGTWKQGYDYPTSHGTYIMQNNEIKFTPTWVDEGIDGFEETLQIHRAADMLGEYKRMEYLSPNSGEEDLGFGCLTRAEFKSEGKDLLKTIGREKK